jgi:hypothetical protein
MACGYLFYAMQMHFLVACPSACNTISICLLGFLFLKFIGSGEKRVVWAAFYWCV